ncbi:semaphorin-3B isoform X2 [Choloepus didactylus]|uniref:semaphorin-3B isoform X2 n=1 Tax=Choloepus didactylus TaxID=27675 RepID=UPI00189DB559|nr:semaphorin-3B isoform X2 [Choloepus didactylus]
MGWAPASAMIPGLALLWAAVLGGAAPSPPRLRLSFQELQARHGLRTFRLARTCCYEALLVDEERGRLFVGAENHVASLSLDNISKRAKKLTWLAPVEWREECNWAGKDIAIECMNFVKMLHMYNRTHLLACGTGAFHPICAFVEVGQGLEPVLRLDLRSLEDGKGKSPYDPKHQAASVLVGEELYSGVAADLMGRDFTIFRSLGHRPSLRTEPHDSRWLNEPKFVKVFWIPESENPDDDKIYFFFRELAVEAAPALGRLSVSRVGQICRNDVGGQRSLVNKWTTFLKARLVCSVPGLEGDTHFDQLQDVFLLPTRDRRSPLLYAVFTTSSGVFQGSAVCVYSMNDVRRAFLGPFAHKEGPTHQWVSYQGRVPYPRPGMCPSKTFGTFSSTKDFPDDVIQFARNHPLMYNPVLPMAGRPLFLQVGAEYTFTQIAADRVAAADGQYDVLFIGTDAGTVLKVISVPKGGRPIGLLLEELHVFEDSAAITSMQISSKRHQLYVASRSAVAQIALHRCAAHGRACAECCLARDPYCAWDGAACTRFQPSAKRRFRRQDIRNGDPSTLCSGDSSRPALLERKVFGVEGGSTFLECEPRSLQARVEWTFQREGEAPRTLVPAEDRAERTAQGLLLRGLRRGDSGVYLCSAVEQGFSQPLRRLSLHVLSSAQAEQLARAEEAVPAASPGPKLWYRDFLQLVEPGGGGASSLRMCRSPPAQRPPPPAPRKKGRNRRTHSPEPRAERWPRSASHW